MFWRSARCTGLAPPYMAAAVGPEGRVTTLDTEAVEPNPRPEQLLTEANLTDRCEVVRIPHSSYTWWLKQQTEMPSDEAENCEPAFDFIYLDGAHTWTIDGLAALLAERLLRPGGWLLLDDVRFIFDRDGGPYGPGMSPEDHRFSGGESAAEQVRAVFRTTSQTAPGFHSISSRG